MKAQIYLLILLFLLPMSAVFGQQNYMYVYRNDGVINAFYKGDIDNICYSRLDLDSIPHNDYVVQEIWAVDSVYRIPLEIIDSVSFITPETVYQPGTVNITAEMREYIKSSEQLQLVFASNTPNNLLPKVGDKLVNIEASGGLLAGFLGQVKNVTRSTNGYQVNCDPINLTDVFECYYGMSFEEKEVPTRGVRDGFYSGDYTWAPEKMSLNLFSTQYFDGLEVSYEPDGNLLIPSLKAEDFSVGLTPKERYFASLIVNKNYGINISIGIYGDYLLEENLSFSGSLTVGQDFPPFFKYNHKFPQAFCEFQFEIGLFLKTSAQIATQQKWTQRYNSSFHWEYSSRGQESIKNINSIKNTENTHSGIVAISGSLEGGVYMNGKIAFIGTSDFDISEVGLRLEGGFHLEGGGRVPYISNQEDALKTTDLYNMLKGKGAELSLYYGTSAYAKLGNWNVSRPLAGDFFGKKHVLKQNYYVPDFQNTKLKQNKDGSYYASTEVSGECDPTDIGFSLQDKYNHNDYINGYSLYDYKGPNSLVTATFYKKTAVEPCIVYPLVKFGDLEMIAEPSADLGIVIPKITDFKQTAAYYSIREFENDGYKYDYKYDVAVTVEMDSLENVEDWGYVYSDPYGTKKHISLMQFGTPYTDIRYSYYRNSNKSTVCLYGYVKYKNEDECHYDEPHKYDVEWQRHFCPDDNHPHAIDLGLPSGTKWSCMNVGAITPEDEGGYYAWGETSEKKVYDEVSYSFCTGENPHNSSFGGQDYYYYSAEYQNLGSDIAGSSYDVAHVKMGGAWRMPSRAQLEELMNSCKISSGSTGTTITGRNGASILFPGTGIKKGAIIDSGLCIRSSTSDGTEPRHAYYLLVMSNGCYIISYSRYFGMTVRAVCP